MWDGAPILKSTYHNPRMQKKITELYCNNETDQYLLRKHFGSLFHGVQFFGIRAVLLLFFYCPMEIALLLFRPGSSEQLTATITFLTSEASINSVLQ
mmetsp:Transcript_17663/g.30861  ORF Transcript_17663/g.30861 Transcript_17663/m.30861 type:complete len:97 (+) Transcript_17663:708-998(+)